MASRNFFAALTILVFIACISLGFVAQARRNNENNISTTQQTESISLTSPETTKPNQVSDLVAYELFFRTVGANNARGLIERAGLGDEQVEKVVAEAKSLNEIYERGGKFKRELRENKNKSTMEKQEGFRRVKEQTETNLTRVVARYLPQGLGDENWRKFQDFIETEVKPKIQTIPVASFNKSNAKNNSKAQFVKTSGNAAGAQTGGNIHLYSAAWAEGENVFGSGTLTEDNTSYTGYLVTTTVTSPSGRNNTTSGDWNYATVANNTGLSIGVEDGTYTIQANFEADLGGYYDEWGNYYSYGTYHVGSSQNSVFVTPQVSIGGVNPVARTVSAGANFTTTVSIRSSTSVPNNTIVGVEFLESNNFNTVLYSVADRSKTVTITNPGTSVTVSFDISVNTASPNGEVISRVRIFSVSGGVAGTGDESGDIGFTVGTLTGGGGGTCGSCGYAGLGCAGCANFGVYGYTNQGCPSGFFNQYGCCCQGSPIVIDIAGNGFAMTNGANGVLFDLADDGIKDQTSWTTANSDDAWLALDRNNNNTIDNGKELFGNYCDQPAPPPGVLRNGFIGLAEFDKAAAGGNGDGKITRADSVFRKLRLWQDRNHNGVSEPEELSRLPALDVVALFLDYRKSRRTDQYGNRFKYKARVRDARGARIGRWAWDVFTVPPQ